MSCTVADKAFDARSSLTIFDKKFSSENHLKQIHIQPLVSFLSKMFVCGFAQSFFSYQPAIPASPSIHRICIFYEQSNFKAIFNLQSKSFRLIHSLLAIKHLVVDFKKIEATAKDASCSPICLIYQHSTVFMRLQGAENL